MADISKIKLPNNSTTYNIKDATAVHIVPYGTFTAGTTIHEGSVDPSQVDTSSFNNGDIYIYVPQS